MAKPSAVISYQINQLPKKELGKLVLKAAGKYKDFHNYLLVNYFDTTHGEEDLFEHAKDDLEVIFKKKYKGFAEELQLANMLAACTKIIMAFSKLCKTKHLEADLIILVLQIPFSLPNNRFTTCFTAYNYKVVTLVKCLIKKVTEKLHEDYKIQCQVTINNYLNILHRFSSHLDCVYNLPKNIYNNKNIWTRNYNLTANAFFATCC
jgi:hypothetical protein